MIDSQSVKTTESGGICGFAAGKKVKGRKRHILTDTCGFLIFILVHAADIQDRDGAADVLAAVRTRFARGSRGCATFSLTAATPAPSCDPPSPAGESGRSKSSSARTTPKVAKCCPAGGSSNEPSDGSGAADASPKIGKSPSPQSACSPAEPQDTVRFEKLPNQTLGSII